MTKTVKKYGWVLAIVGTCLCVALQLGVMRDLDRRSDALRSLLSETQTLALMVCNRIGYGGLIHNYKNVILRPTEKKYYTNAVVDAEVAIVLIADLEKNAVALGSKLLLTDTRAMIKGYRDRLDKISTLYEAGHDVKEVDVALRYNDTHAIQEIDALLINLSGIVESAVISIGSDIRVMTWVGIGGSLVLGGFVLALMRYQHQRRNYLQAMQAVNQKLEASNSYLSSVNTSLQQFAGIVSHDLKTPLRHINFFSELISEDIDDKQQVEEQVSKIKTAAQKMDRMIESLLEFARTGFTQPRPESIDVQLLINDVMAELRPSIESAGATVTMDLQGKVSADQELIRRVLHNVLCNSLKYRYPDRALQIEVITRPVGDKIEFAITDNGIGIEPQYSDRVFEPWQRLHDSQGEFEGSGIGLSLVKSVIAAHGGTVLLDTSYKSGTRIKFYLAAAETETFAKAA